MWRKPAQPTKEQVFQCAKELEVALTKQSINYAFVGGLAVKIWGGSRMTDDVDTAVDVTAKDPEDSEELTSSQKIQALREKIARSNPKMWEAVIAKPPLVYFTNEDRKLATQIGCDILGAPGIAGPPLSDQTTMTVSNEYLGETRVLKMPYLLYSKLLAWDSRGDSGREKAKTDSIDIEFLVRQLALEKADMQVYLNKSHWDKEGLTEKVNEVATKWTKAATGGKGMDTEESWAAINVKLT